MFHIGFGEKWLILSGVLCMIAHYSGGTIALAGLMIAIVLSIREQMIKMNFWQNCGVPGPKPNLLIGNILNFYRYGQKKVDIENRNKFGNFYGVNMLGRPLLVVTDFALLRQVFIRDFKLFMNRPWQHHLVGETNLFNHILFTMRDQRWKEVRTVMSPNFSTGRLKRIFPILSECTSIAVKIIQENLSKGSSNFDTRKILGNLVMDTVAKSAFGVNGDFQHHDDLLFVRMVNKVFQFSLIGPYRVFMELFPNFAYLLRLLFGYELISRDLNDYFIRIVKQTITERISNTDIKHNDFLQMIIESSVFSNCSDKAEDKQIDDEKMKLSEIETIAQSFLFIAAGYETTTTTLQCAFYSMAVNPEIQQKAYEEVVRVIGDKEHIDYEDLPKMDYIGSIVMETLRMYPPVGSCRRECTQQTILNDVTLRKGQAITMPVFAIHYNELYYHQPDQFNPERFSADEIKNRDPLAFCPFGFGPRQCIGMRLALQNARMIIASLVRRFRFSADQYVEGAPLMIDSFGITRPTKPIILQVDHRSQSD